MRHRALALAGMAVLAAAIAPAPQSCRAAEPVAGLTALAGDSWVLLKWSAGQEMLDPPTASYPVLRDSELSGTAYPESGAPDTCAFSIDDSRVYWDLTVTNGTAYSYEIGRLEDTVTTWSPSVAITATVTGNLPAFGTVWTQSGDRYVKLQWRLFSSCDGPEKGGVSMYRVFRSTHPSFCNRSLYEVSLADYYLDTNLVNLTSYYYMVFPCCPDRMPSFVAARPYRWARGQGVPSARTDPAAPRAIRLTWDPAIPGDYAPVSMYAVFRSDDGGATMGRVGTAVGQLTYLDEIPVYGHRYLYLIRPIDAEGNLGEAYRIIVLDVPQPINRLFLHRNRFRPGLSESLPISYQLTETGRVRIAVFTPTGERVRRLYEADISGSFGPDAPFNSVDRGVPFIRWDGANDAGELVASGAYLVVLEINQARDIRTVAVIR